MKRDQAERIMPDTENSAGIDPVYAEMYRRAVRDRAYAERLGSEGRSAIEQGFLPEEAEDIMER
jgi:hypothetical protein